MNAMKSVVSASFCLAATLAAGVAGAESRTVGDVDGLFAAVADASVVEVVLTAKTYEIAEPLRLKRAVTVRSESGVPEDVIIHQTTTSENTSSDETGQLGRCFYIDHAQAFVSGLTIENGNCSDNSKGRAGGNVFITANGGTVSNCVIRNGRGLSNWGSGGGGVGMYGGLVTHCVISNNASHTNKGGAGAYVDGGTLANSLVTGNAFNGGGASDNGGVVSVQKGRVLNCTIAGNDVPYSCAGVYANGGEIVNCVIGANTTANGGADTAAVYKGKGSCFKYCAASVDFNGGTECRAGDVGFRNAKTGDYRLLVSSPALDAGTKLDGQSATDLAGNPRVDAKTGLIDMGCFENPRTEFAVAFSTDRTAGSYPLEVTFTVSADGLQGATSYVWDFDGTEQGRVTTSDPVYTYVFETPGFFTPTLKVIDDAGEHTDIPSAGTIMTAGPVVWVNGSAATHTPPYATRETGAASVADALALGLPGVPVVIATGTYEIDHVIELNSAYEVRGETGDPTDVVIRQTVQSVLNSADQIGRVFYLNHKDAKVLSLTMLNGDSNDGSHGKPGACVFVDTNGGTVSNCVITGGNARGWASGGGGAALYAGLLTHSVVTNNQANSDSRGGSGVYLEGAAIAANCLIADNSFNSDAAGRVGGALSLDNGAKAYNCTIAGNKSDFSCAGVSIGTRGTCGVYNCVIAGNAVNNDSGTLSVYNAKAAASFHACASSLEIVGGDACVNGTVSFVGASRGDYHLAAGAVAIGQGRPGLDESGTVDLDGNPRFADDGVIDCGCYQLVRGQASAGYSVDFEKGIAPLTVTFTVSAEGFEGDYSFVWDFNGDGVTVTRAATEPLVFTHDYDQPGQYAPTFKVVTESGEVAGVGKANIRVFGPTLYVDPASTNPVFPYATPQTAINDLFAAYEAALDRVTVKIAPGVYTNAHELQIYRNVRIEGQTGNPEDVVFCRPGGEKNYWRLVTLSNPGAVLANLTLHGGVVYETNGKMGGALLVESGTASNLVVRNATAHHYNAHGGGVALTGGRLTRSAVTNCTSALHEFGGTGVFCDGGTVDNCLIAYNKSNHNSGDKPVGGAVTVRSGLCVNCTVVGNTTSDGCAGILSQGGKVCNCLVLDNTTGRPRAGLEGTDPYYGGDLADFSHNVAGAAFGDGAFLTATAERPFAFVDREDGNYRAARAGCVTVNAGVRTVPGDAYGVLTGLDLDGNRRAVTRPDVGCYESCFVNGLLIHLR